jgi:mono/diheme cytochrome c family protein
MRTRILAYAAMSAVFAVATVSAHASPRQIERGKYLVTISGCSDCHTAGSLEGKPDMAHYLGGGDIGWALPGLGTFVPPNLTPDKATGLGNWTRKQIVTAIMTGKRPDGRILAPIMPWQDFAHLHRRDAFAIAAYLKSLPPVHHQVPGPFGAKDKPPIPVYAIVAPDNAAPAHK